MCLLKNAKPRDQQLCIYLDIFLLTVSHLSSATHKVTPHFSQKDDTTKKLFISGFDG